MYALGDSGACVLDTNQELSNPATKEIVHIHVPQIGIEPAQIPLRISSRSAAGDAP
jgi:hypothetical protein